ncbi:MAG: alpha/beta hydrolase [bacterium]|jgi:pimeloyl-ACP methyl ester carboxylesterase
MPFVTIHEKIEIFYILHKNKNNNGQTKTIVLIHGVGGSHLSMLYIFDYIKKKWGNFFNILIFDLPFHYKSIYAENTDNIANKKININFYSSTLKELLEKLHLISKKNIILIGHSMGAQVCLRYASLFAEDINKIMLIAGCDNVHIKDSFILSLHNNYDRTIKLFLKDAYSKEIYFDKIKFQNAINDINRTFYKIVINDFIAVKSFAADKEINFSELNKKNIYFNILYSNQDKIINKDCIFALKNKLSCVKLSLVENKSHIEIIFDGYKLNNFIDKFLEQ